MTERERIRIYLERDFSESLRDPLWKSLALSPPLLRILDLEPVQKLNRIKQLGPTYLVYPGATHTRLSHSLGVLHLARRMIGRLAVSEGAPDLSLDGVKAFLCAALLHDLGHFPYAHSLKDLDLATHERLTGERIVQEPLRSALRREAEVDPELVAALVDPDRPWSGDEVGFFRNILSGVLDPDKLDYLNRDAYFCGVPYGVQDVDFVLASIVADRERGVATTPKGVLAVESVLFSRYLMWRSVYWHKTVRVATAMIKKALLMALAAGELRKEDLYGLDDQEFFASMAARSYPPLALASDVLHRRLYRTAASVAFDARNGLHRRLVDLAERSRFETALAGEIGRRAGCRVASEEVIVDIPEPVSFEMDVPIIDPVGNTRVPYGRSETVFGPAVIEGFTRTLRHVALITSRRPELEAALEGMRPAALLTEGLPG